MMRKIPYVLVLIVQSVSIFGMQRAFFRTRRSIITPQTKSIFCVKRNVHTSSFLRSPYAIPFTRETCKKYRNSIEPNAKIFGKEIFLKEKENYVCAVKRWELERVSGVFLACTLPFITLVMTPKYIYDALSTPKPKKDLAVPILEKNIDAAIQKGRDFVRKKHRDMSRESIIKILKKAEQDLKKIRELVDNDKAFKEIAKEKWKTIFYLKRQIDPVSVIAASNGINKAYPKTFEGWWG